MKVSSDRNESRGVTGLVPAAGRGIRLAGLEQGSKEIVDLAGEPVLVRLLRRFELAEIHRVLVVLREGKTDVPKAIVQYPGLEPPVGYVVVQETPSELHSVAEGLLRCMGDLVVLGYPDVVFEPKRAFLDLLDRQSYSGADLVLGLFPTDTPSRVDMVELDGQMRPVEIVIKQPDRGLRYSWCMAVWTPMFSRYLIEYVANLDDDSTGLASKHPSVEASVGEVIQAALLSDVQVEAVTFDEGYYIDIGTPEALAEARQRFKA